MITINIDFFDSENNVIQSNGFKVGDKADMQAIIDILDSVSKYRFEYNWRTE